MGGDSSSFSTGEVNQTVSIPNCVGIQATVSASSLGTGGNPSQANSTVSLYEIQAWGVYVPYKDIGLRIEGGTNIGVLPLSSGTYPLRVRSGGTTYGIPLLPTSNAWATPVRMSMGGTTYALPNASYTPTVSLITTPTCTAIYSDNQGDEGGGPGSTDGDWSTSYNVSNSQVSTGNTSTSSLSTILTFPPTLVTQISYSAYGESYAYSNYQISGSQGYAIYYTLDGANWTLLWSGGNSFCWVAAAIFEGGWDDIRTHLARYFILNIAPRWFRDIYAAKGEKFAAYISDKMFLKIALKPLFEIFAFIGHLAIVSPLRTFWGLLNWR